MNGMKTVCAAVAVALMCWVRPVAAEQEIPLSRGVETTLPQPAPGFVGIKDGHLIRDGQRLRIWGINCVNGNRRPKADQDRILDRIAAMGFNGIRLHLYDWRLIPEGGNGYEIATYTKGDDSPMDLFDYFLAGAAKRNLVLYMTMDRKESRILPSAYDLLPAGEGDDEVRWKQALAELQDRPSQPTTDFEQVWLTDARLEAVAHTYARNLLNHVNQYTGRKLADEPSIGLWELANESCYIDRILDGTSHALKGYWGVETQKLWNEFLKKHYGTTTALQKRWGSLLEGESLEGGTIQLQPLPAPKTDKPYSEDAKFPSRRIHDLLTFFVNRYIDQNSELVATMRACASKPNEGIAVTPIGFDTHFEPSLLNIYCAGAGDVAIAGTYKWYRTFDTSDPTYPFTSSLAGGGWYGMDLAPIKGKPTVTYEINVHRPAPYRAAFPMVVSAYTQSQDWDAVFWYYWMDGGPLTPSPLNYQEVRDQGYLRYDSLSDQWAGVNVSCDEILLGSLHLAGLMFRQGSLRPAPHPAQIALSPDDLIWSYNSMGAWMKVISSAENRTGARLRFLPDGTAPRGIPTDAPDSPAMTQYGPDVRIDNAKRQMISDSANVKMFAGWPTRPVVGFSDGIRLTGLEPGKFIAFALASEDGRPIAQSKKLVVTLLGTSQNTGYVYDPKASKSTGFIGMIEGIVNKGENPVVIDWPAATVELGAGRSGSCTWYNAFPEAFEKQAFSGSIVFDGKRPAAWAHVMIDPKE
jgi:hypothetical protein